MEYLSDINGRFVGVFATFWISCTKKKCEEATLIEIVSAMCELLESSVIRRSHLDIKLQTKRKGLSILTKVVIRVDLT